MSFLQAGTNNQFDVLKLSLDVLRHNGSFINNSAQFLIPRLPMPIVVFCAMNENNKATKHRPYQFLMMLVTFDGGERKPNVRPVAFVSFPCMAMQSILPLL